jgi:hypothetical protein
VRRQTAATARRGPSAWGWMVTVSACVVVGCGVALAVWWALTSERRVATYAVQGTVNAIFLDLGAADADVVGGGNRASVEVRRTDEFAFGRRAIARRDAAGGILRLISRCPHAVLGACEASYRLTVPDNVPVTVRTSTGNVRFAGYQGSARIDTSAGDIAVASYCGFSLRARTEDGDVTAGASCAPERLELRSRTGDVRAVVPPGRYRVDAVSDDGERRVRGVTAADDAPFQIQALTSGGDVDVEGAG